MARVLQFPDGNRVSGASVAFWYVNGSAQPTINLSGLFSSQIYSWTGCPNVDVANAIIAIIDQWFFAQLDSFIIVQATLGMYISSISPTTGTAADNITVTVTGVAFVNDCTCTIGGVSCIVTFTNSTTLSVAYVGGSLGAGTYDLTVTNPNGATFTLHQCLTLS